MNISLIFDYGIDIIEIPNMEYNSIKKLQEKFYKWCYNKDNSLTFNKSSRALCFDGKTFVDWLNNVEKIPSKMLNSNIVYDSESYPSIYF